jgi:glycosyltransferase involved in cell wall biosynthesis
MVVVASAEIQSEFAATAYPPLISIIVPVYNGSAKIGPTLQKIKIQVEKLEPVVRKLAQKGQQKKAPAFTGRKVIENAGAAMLLDGYLSAHPGDIHLNIDFNDVKDDEMPDGTAGSGWYEIIVVNDGSRDGTRKVVQSISMADSTVRLISYSTNMGKGYAIKQGVLHSHGRYVMFLDGDGEISTDVLSKYLTGIAAADIVIGSKYHKLSEVNVPSSRKFFSKCFHLLVKLLLGVKQSDTQVGLKVGRGEVFRKIFGRVTVKRYAFDAEMLAVADMMGLKVVELPVKIDLDKSFKKKEIIKMALDLIGVAYRLRVVKWYQKTIDMKRPSFERFAIA